MVADCAAAEGVVSLITGSVSGVTGNCTFEKTALVAAHHDDIWRLSLFLTRASL